MLIVKLIHSERNWGVQAVT